MMGARGVASVWVALLWACASGSPLAQEKNSAPLPVQTEMHNILYRFTGDVSVRIFDLDGALLATSGHALAVFDEPPSFQINIRAARISIAGDQLLMIFGSGRSTSGLYRGGGNYMAFRGGQLRFGKLTMNDSDMVLIDADPKDSFDFFLDHYKEQLVAGYSKNTMQDGLRVHMPDYGKLRVRRNKQ